MPQLCFNRAERRLTDDNYIYVHNEDEVLGWARFFNRYCWAKASHVIGVLGAAYQLSIKIHLVKLPPSPLIILLLIF
jgi:hypothetical protein